MKIVLANTVGIDSGGWTIIPYASRWTTASKGSEDGFTYYPRDLGYLSSLLKRDTYHDVKLIDGCLRRMNREEYAEAIASQSPGWLVMENSSRTFMDDAWVISEVRKRTGAKVMLAGQHVTAFPHEGLKYADVVAQGEYLKTALDFFAGGAKGGGIIPVDRAGFIDVAALPFPEDDDVSRWDYTRYLDPICEYREIQIYATRGCPYGCVYCVARHSYYDGPSFRPRPAENVVDEIASLAEKYPQVEGFFFDDEIHNANIRYTKELARAIIAAGLNGYRYNAMCAYGPFDREAMELMKEAGYYKIRVGIETASDDVARGMGLKGKHRPEKLLETLELAREAGIKVYGTFTLGGKGASERADMETIEMMGGLIRSNLLHDCQVSICTPQPGTPFFDWARSEGLIGVTDWSRFDGGEDAVLSLPGYPAKSILAMRARALQEYDDARRERDTALFQKNFRLAARGLGRPPRNLLAFRSAREWSLDNALSAIFGAWDCNVAFLCHSPMAERYRRMYPRMEIIEVDDSGFLSWDRLSGDVRERLRRFGADLALVPTNTIHNRGYGNIVRIAANSGVEDIRHLNAMGEMIKTDSGGVNNPAEQEARQ